LEVRAVPTTCTVDRLTDNNPSGGGEGTDGMGDLRWCAIESLFRADTIDFSVTGTINLAAALPTLTGNVNIDGPGASLLTVRRNTGGDYNIFALGSGVTVGISGLTMSNGDGSPGGAVYDNGGTLTISSSVVSGNPGSASVYNNNGTLTVNYSTISGNTGGGFFSNATLTVNYSTVSGNGSTSLVYGGGFFTNGGTLTINSSTVSGNTVLLQGGGIYNGGTATVNDSTVVGNSASSAGGGILNDSGRRLTINNSTVAGNSVTNSNGSGGGIFAFMGSTLAPRDTIIAANTAFLGPDVYGNLGSQGHNLIGNPQDMTGWVSSDLLHVNAMLGPLADNGGPTLTRALLPGSPAIDAGDNAGAPPWDQRGAPFRRVVNGAIDIGAFEVQAGGHGGPTRQPLPDPVPVQVLGMAAGPLFGQLPTPPADASPLSGTGAPDGQAGQPGTDPVPIPTAGGQLAPEAFTVDGGNGQPVDTLGPFDGVPLELPTLGLSG
jgi:hypothetical protein